IQGIKALSLNPRIVEAQQDLKIVFSPIHGTGITVVPKTLEAWGFRNVNLVEAQANPEGNFPTVVYPNPEEKEAMKLAIAKGQAIDADLVMATDPDADRVGVAVKNKDGDFVLLNGNQIFSLLAEYVLRSLQESGRSFDNSYIVKTIVTSNLIQEIARKYGIKCYDVLTGFKYIGELMTLKRGKEEFVIGGEESYGFLVGDLVRDKDAVVSCAFIAEMTAYFKDQGKTLYETLLDIYAQYGYFQEKQVSITKTGKSGAEEIVAMMNQFRATPPRYLGGIEVIEIRDYKQSVALTVNTKREEPIELPKSDVRSEESRVGKGW